MWFHTNTYLYNIVKTKHLFHSISIPYHFNKDFHEFVFTILPQSPFNTLMDLSYSAFVSKLFISNDSLILRSRMLDNFASVFQCSELNRPWHSLECSVGPGASHFSVILSSWCSIDRVSTRHFVSPIYYPPQSQLNS